MHRLKRAKSATAQDPAASAEQGVGTAEIIAISPQLSPLREDVVQVPPTSTSTGVPIAEPIVEMEEACQEKKRQEADPTTAPPSINVPESASPTRASIDEPAHTGATPTSGAADDRAPATRVAREGDVLPRQAPTGNPLAFAHSFQERFPFLSS